MSDAPNRTSPAGMLDRAHVGGTDRALVWAWGLSVLMHVILLGLLFSVALPGTLTPDAERPVNVRLHLPSVGDTRAKLIEPVQPNADEKDEAREPESKDQDARQINPDDRIIRDFPLAEFQAKSPVAGDTQSGTSANSDSEIAGPGFGSISGGLSVIGLGGGSGSKDFSSLGIGGGGGPQFFGVGGSAKEAKKIVYVVDRSGSMSDTFGYVRAELKRSVSTLRRTQQFHVIFFNSGAPLENPPKRLVSAIDANRHDFFKFLETVTPMGDTQPEGAMYLALSLNPDLVYLLSDGIKFDQGLLTKLNEWNRDRKAKIFTIAYLDREGGAILERIAREHSGEFKYVTENDLP